MKTQDIIFRSRISKRDISYIEDLIKALSELSPAENSTKIRSLKLKYGL